MDIEVLDFKPGSFCGGVARVFIRYYKLILKCDLVYYSSENKAWIRMPEMWRNNGDKHKFAYWPSKEISDEFQIIVLNKIFDKYGIDVEKVAKMHLDNREKRKTKKNV